MPNKSGNIAMDIYHQKTEEGYIGSSLEYNIREIGIKDKEDEEQKRLLQELKHN